MRKDKEIAIRLRKEGKSYNEINKFLKIPKSTLSGWLRGIEISQKAKEKLWNESRRKWAENFTIYNKKRSKTALENAWLAQRAASRKIGHLNKKGLLLIGTAIYWAEGNKRDRWNVKFCNSDPAIIKIMMDFL